MDYSQLSRKMKVRRNIQMIPKDCCTKTKQEGFIIAAQELEMYEPFDKNSFVMFSTDGQLRNSCKIRIGGLLNPESIISFLNAALVAEKPPEIKKVVAEPAAIAPKTKRTVSRQVLAERKLLTFFREILGAPKNNFGTVTP